MALPAGKIERTGSRRSQALAQYHLRSETKFLNGEYCDRGRTERRHVLATQLMHIGKEANKWEERYFLGADEEAEIEYDLAEAAEVINERIHSVCRELGQREAARQLGISRAALRRALKIGVHKLSGSMLLRLQRSEKVALEPARRTRATLSVRRLTQPRRSKA